MFCSKCRRRLFFKKTKKSGDLTFNSYNISTEFITYYSNNPRDSKAHYIDQISKNKLSCPACKEKLGKSYKIKLGVSERVDVISSYEKPQHPNHRPPYFNAIPLVDIIRAVKGIKSTSSSTVTKLYEKTIQELGSEFTILLDLDIEKIKHFNESMGDIIEALRKDEIEYVPGGGGNYGQINFNL